jgi:hypothetical protein
LTHLPYILASYSIFAVLAAWLAVGAAMRLRHALARLRAVDPRAAQSAERDPP